MLGRRTKWSTNISKPAKDDEGNGEKTQGERWLGDMIKVVLHLQERFIIWLFHHLSHTVQLYNKDNKTLWIVKVETRKEINWVEGVTVQPPSEGLL